MEAASEPRPITVFIHSRNRPLYLWASLDSLYRHTSHPHRFVLLDMASDDPLVRQVVAGFERRGMFSEVIWWPRNDVHDFWALLWRRLPDLGPYFAYCQSDVVVEAGEPCWLSVFAALMRGNHRLAMLGSAIDKRDFVDLDAARRLDPQLDDGVLRELIKWSSPERSQDAASAEGPIFAPHNPPGRLVMLRSAALARAGAAEDGTLHRKFLEAGYETGIATAVRHRHLSLLHIYDYPDYDYERREAFLRGRPGASAAVVAAPAPAPEGSPRPDAGSGPTTEVRVAISLNRNFAAMARLLATSLAAHAEFPGDWRLVFTVSPDTDQDFTSPLLDWARQYPIEFRWVDQALYAAYGYAGTSFQRFLYKPDADVVLFLDADILATGPIGELLCETADAGAVVARTNWGPPRGVDLNELLARRGLSPVEPRLTYSGWGIEFLSPRHCPPLLNGGVISVPRGAARDIAGTIADDIAFVHERHGVLLNGELALFLNIVRNGCACRAMDPRFNLGNGAPLPFRFPGDDEAAAAYAAMMACCGDPRLLHYCVRSEAFDKTRDFDGWDRVLEFSGRAASGGNNDLLLHGLRAVLSRTDPAGMARPEDVASRLPPGVRVTGSSGLYRDGWTSERVRIEFCAATPVERLTLFLYVPEKGFRRRTGRSLWLAVNGVETAVELRAGGYTPVSVPVSAGPGEAAAIELRDPGTVADEGGGRRIGVMLSALHAE